MLQQKIKNVILFLMVAVCVYLSSQVWMKAPEFIINEKEGTLPEDIDIETDVWSIIKPLKSVIRYKDNYTVLYSDKEFNMWEMAVDVINEALTSMQTNNISFNAAFPSDYIKFDFTTNIPVEIFAGLMKIDNPDVFNTIKSIKNVIMDLNNKNCIYIYNGEDTIKIESTSINSENISNTIKAINFSLYTQYSSNQKIGEESIKIPVPLEETALSTVFVESELDVLDTEAVNKIAKDYFKNDYDYVRKSVEVNGNLVYMYRTEKVLKINEEGLLDFYDANNKYDSNGKTDLYQSFLTAVDFTEDFLGFPEDVYLSDVDSIQNDGDYGIRFIFSYKLLDRPILFSKVRENAALQIDVIEDKVVSYKRFIRNIDKTQEDKMLEISVLPVVDVIAKSIQEEGMEESLELRPLKKDMISKISNIYLGYFDLSRIAREQVLRVVWVVEIENKSFIFNAISGALIEEW